MDCERFKIWLEERDLSDLSESDRATKHAKECENCQVMADKDELLDQTIGRALAREPLPDQLEKIVALNLGSGAASKRRFSTGMIKFTSLCSGIAALLLVFFMVPDSYSPQDDFGIALASDHEANHTTHPVDSVSNLSGWLKKYAGFSASLPAEFSLDELELFGVRICIIENCQTVHLVYNDGSGFVSLYIVDATQVPATLKEGKMYSVSQKGLHIKMWRENNQVYALIS